jgi:hypothetical protein
VCERIPPEIPPYRPWIRDFLDHWTGCTTVLPWSGTREVVVYTGGDRGMFRARHQEGGGHAAGHVRCERWGWRRSSVCKSSFTLPLLYRATMVRLMNRRISSWQAVLRVRTGLPRGSRTRFGTRVRRRCGLVMIVRRMVPCCRRDSWIMSICRQVDWEELGIGSCCLRWSCIFTIPLFLR